MTPENISRRGGLSISAPIRAATSKRARPLPFAVTLIRSVAISALRPRDCFSHSIGDQGGVGATRCSRDRSVGQHRGMNKTLKVCSQGPLNIVRSISPPTPGECKMICVYDMASSERLQRKRSTERPAPVLRDGPADILHPILQLQEVPLVQKHEPAWLKSDLMLKPIDSFFE